MGYDSEEFRRGFPPAPKGNFDENPAGFDSVSQSWQPPQEEPSTPYAFAESGITPPPPPGARGTRFLDSKRRRNAAIGAAIAIVLVTFGTLGYVLFGGTNGSPQQSAVGRVSVATDTATSYPPTSTTAPGQPSPTPYPPTATANPLVSGATVTFTRSTQAISVTPTLTSPL